MTDKELNASIASAMGLTLGKYDAWLDAKGNAIVHSVDFFPATSVDALRKWVLPEIVNRGVFAQWVDSVIRKTPGANAWKMMKSAKIRAHLIDRDPAESSYAIAAVLFLSPPAVLAAAALAVLEADNA